MNADVVLNLSYLEVLFYLQGASAFIYAWWRTKNPGFLVLLAAVTLFWVPLRDCAVKWVVRDLLLTLFPIGSKELNAEYIYGFIIRRSVAWTLVTAFQIMMAVFGLGLIVKGLAKAKADVNGVSWKVRMRKTLLPIAAVVVGGPLVMFLVGAACVHFSASARHASVTRQQVAGGRSSGEQENNNGIGTAQMAADGTITLQLRAEGKSGGERAVGDATLVYKKDDPKYKDILDHLGGMKPGESKSVKPWPEPTAAGKTNGVVNVPGK